MKDTTDILLVTSLQKIFIELGWKKSYIEKAIDTRDVQLLIVMSSEDFIKKCIQLWYPKDADNMEWYTIFKTCGLRKVTIDNLIDVITPLFNSCYGTNHLYDIAFEYLIGSLSHVKNTNNFYIGLDQPTNTWLSNDSYKYFYNVTQLKPSKLVTSYFPSIINTIPIHNTQKHQLYFHATKWEYAKQIIEFISHSKGRECFDFGMTPSFYLTPNIYIAFEWCQKHSKHWNSEACILVYNIDTKNIPVKK